MDNIVTAILTSVVTLATVYIFRRKPPSLTPAEDPSHDDVDHYQDLLHQKDITISHLNTQLQHAHTQLEHHYIDRDKDKDKDEDKDVMCRSLHDTIDTLNNKLTIKDKEILRLNERIDRLKEKSHTVQNTEGEEVSDINSILDEKINEISTLHTNEDTLKHEYETQLLDLNIILNGKDTTIGELKREIETLQKSSQDKQNHVELLQKDLEQLKDIQSISEPSDAEVKTLGNLVLEKETEIEELRSKYAELSETFKRVQNGLEDEIDEIDSQLKSAAMLIKFKEADIENWEGKYFDLEEEHEKALNQIEELDEDLADALEKIILLKAGKTPADDISVDDLADEEIEYYYETDSELDEEFSGTEIAEHNTFNRERESKWYNISYSKNTPGDWVHHSSKPIVMDTGSYSVKVGLSGNEVPDIVLNVLSENANSSGMNTFHQSFKENVTEIGETAWKPLRKQEFPMVGGAVGNWEFMEKVWDYTFDEVMNLDPSNAPIFLVDKFGTPRLQRDTTAQVMFETFNTPGIYFGNDSLMGLLVHNNLTGIVVDSGYEKTQVVPYYEGMPVFPAFSMKPISKEVNMGGRTITKLLEVLISQKEDGASVKESIARSIKHKYSSFQPKDNEIVFELRDGHSMSLGSEVHNCTEIIFSQYELHNAVIDVINTCPEYMRTSLANNVVTIGGNSVIPGYNERLESEIRKTIHKAKVRGHKESMYYAWRGASIASTTTSVANSWVSREEFEEIGPIAVTRKVIF